jgi:ubiquinone/menaquinone biosynthesis C-methylase UbiE
MLTTAIPTTVPLSDADVLLNSLELKGKRVIDIGCGEGGLALKMSQRGAEVIGIDPDKDCIAAARIANSATSDKFHEGIAEDMVLDDRSVDIAVFFNSLHHVAVESMGNALAEAARVLKANGELYISEPMASGSHFETMRLFSDESRVRNAAYEAIKKMVVSGRFEEIEERTNVRPRLVKDFDAFCREIVDAGNAKRSAILEQRKSEIRSLFEQHGRKVPDGYEFARLTRINRLRKI